MKRQWLAAAVLLAVPSIVPAQTYPARTVRIVLPFAAGSAVDVLARFYGQKMSETWKQQVVIDNRTGASGIIGTEIAARAPADGYTLYMGNVATLAINPGIYAKLPFDVVKDFAPISLVAAINSCLIVHPSLPVKNVKELIAFARARPGQLNYASGGVGSAQHIPMEMLKSMTGIDIVHVSYKGLTPAFNDVVAGQVPMMFPGVVTALPFHQVGRVRIIATTAARRTAATPDIPTVAESGVPGFEWDSWTGFLAPSGTPQEAIARIHAEVVRITRLPDTKEKLPGFEWIGGTPQEFASHIKVNIATVAKVVKQANIKAE